MYINEDTPMTAPAAARYFTMAGAPVTAAMARNWASRARARGNPMPVVDRAGPRGAPRYRLVDWLAAERSARENDTGRGRARSAA